MCLDFYADDCTSNCNGQEYIRYMREISQLLAERTLLTKKWGVDGRVKVWDPVDKAGSGSLGLVRAGRGIGTTRWT